MLGEAPGPLNFTMFLTLFGEKLNGTDPEDVIKNAFSHFDEEGSGKINEDKYVLMISHPLVVTYMRVIDYLCFCGMYIQLRSYLVLTSNMYSG